MINSSNSEQFSNTFPRIDVTEEGIDTYFNDLQPKNASFPEFIERISIFFNLIDQLNCE